MHLSLTFYIVLTSIALRLGACYSSHLFQCSNNLCESDNDCSRESNDNCKSCIFNGWGQQVCSDGQDCRLVRCAGCPPGQCGPISQGTCCQDLRQCSSSGCCDSPCSKDSDCKLGPCRSCIFNGFGQQVCGDPSKDCSKTFCFAACPPGECAPRNKDQCCDDIGKCSTIGCCGFECESDSDCKPGTCGKCIVNGFGKRVCGQPEKDCSRVRCFGACQPGTCSPRTEDTCCDDLGQCSASNCCGTSCQNDNDCNNAPCRKCITNGLSKQVCGTKDKDCSNVRCLGACSPGTCSPRTEDTCCDDLGQCSPNNCNDDPTNCAAVLCQACPTGQCAPLKGCCPDLDRCSPFNCDHDGGNPNCAAVLCQGCPTGQCAPLKGCCPDLDRCSEEACEDDDFDFGQCAAVSCLACPRGQCAPRKGCCPDLDKCSRSNCLQ